MDDRERWRPASEPPECTAEADADVIVEFLYGGKLITERANYADEKRGMKPPGFFSEYGDRFDAEIIRWRYWPEPPTPEQEERRRLEERVRAYGAKCLLSHPHTDGATEEIRAILREWAAPDVR
jgi:hypothetical protein